MILWKLDLIKKNIAIALFYSITLYVRQQKRHRCIQQSFGLCGRGQGWDGLGTGCLGLVHWDDPERWYGEGGGRGVQDWEHVYTRGRFMLMYGKTNTVL